MYTRTFKSHAIASIQDYLTETVGQSQTAIVKKWAVQGIMTDIAKVVTEKKVDKRWSTRLGVSFLLYPSGTLEVYTQEKGRGAI